MATFADRLGRRWELSLTVADLPRIKAAGLDLSELFRSADRAGDLLFLPPDTAGRVLWTLCERQAEKAGVSPDQFAEGFDGPALASGVDALVDAIADFRHRPAVAAAVRANLPTARAALDRAMAAAVTTMLTGSTLSGTAGNSPGPSGSIPGP